MQHWNDYYESSSFTEGYVSAFDLYGGASTFKLENLLNEQLELEYIHDMIKNSFEDVGLALSRAMISFENIEKPHARTEKIK